MTQIKLYGILKEEFGESIFLNIDSASDIFDAIDANRNGFKKRIVDLSQQGFRYAVLLNGKKIQNLQGFMDSKKPKTVDLIPILGGDGWGEIIMLIISIAATILLAPDPPKPPEVTQTTAALEKSFTFSNLVNRAAQGTPVPVGYGELLVGSEVIQATIKSYPQNQRSFEAFRRNPFNGTENPTQSSSQLI